MMAAILEIVRPDAPLRRRHGGRAVARRCGRRARQHHRPERRRQDHRVQPGHRALDGAGRRTCDLPDRDITGLPAEQLPALGFARTFQHGRVFGNLSVLDNVLVGAHTRLDAVRPQWPLDRSPRGACARAGAARLRSKPRRTALRADAMEILALFGERLTPRADNPAFSLSYANRRRLEIARALSLRPRAAASWTSRPPA